MAEYPKSSQGRGTPDELFHAVILLTSTIGFPSTSAALSWVSDTIGEQRGELKP
ncbi:MAG: hypothetical protein AB9866_17895 [Syntrophobacteraceae bacterium]